MVLYHRKRKKIKQGKKYLINVIGLINLFYGGMWNFRHCGLDNELNSYMGLKKS